MTRNTKLLQIVALALVIAVAVACHDAEKKAATALDVARVACNAVAEARAVELELPKEEAFERFCDTREAIAPWLEAAQHAEQALDAGVVVDVPEAGE